MVSKICYTTVIMLQLCYVTAANQRTIVEIELLATVGWKCGCQPFSCPRSQNVTHCRKEICSTCSFKESIPAIPFWNSKRPLAAGSRFLRADCVQCALHYGCIMPVPLLQRQEKDASYAEKQRVWSRSFFLQDLLQCSDCALSCAI